MTVKMDKTKSDLVSLYRCLSCGRLRICEVKNYHPWCLTCMYDEFDWAYGYENITREEAEKLMREEN